MTIRDRMKGVLVGRQDKRYERRLEQLRLTHDMWEKQREMDLALTGNCRVRYLGEEKFTPLQTEGGEQASEAMPEEVPELFCVLYSDIEHFIESGELLKREDGEIVVFAAGKGRLSAAAGTLIYTWFVEHPTGKLVYGDEDVLYSDGSYRDPYFKPDWSPDTYTSCFYIGSVFAVRGSVLKNALLHAASETLTEEQKKQRGHLLGGLPDALFLKLATAAGGFKIRHGEEFPIGHIPEILFHLEEGQDLYSGRKYPTAPSNRGKRFLLPLSGIKEDMRAELVSIIIPTKDHPDILTACIDSIRETATEACPYEILIVDNGSTGYNKLLIANYAARCERKNGLVDIRYIHEPMPFNFSKMCNLGASRARGNLLLFLNDDITARDKDWLCEMAYFAARDYVAAVGAKLLYPPQPEGEDAPEIRDPRDGGSVSEKIQHAGVTNVRLGPMHKLQYMTDTRAHSHGFNRGVHDLLAVTGACLMIEKKKYEAAGGLPEDMAVAFNDVDLCYKLFEQGYYNVQLNHVTLYHHESLSRGLDTLDLAKMERLAGEHRVLMGRHPQLYNVDPFYSPHLVEDEHISEIVPLYEAMQPEEIPIGNLSHHAEGLPDTPADAVVRIGVEYADTLGYWLTGRREDESTGYYIKGYAFVIGADNACYDRRLLLRRITEQETSDTGTRVIVADAQIWSVPVNDWYRPDISAKLPDQQNVELAGYRVRIGQKDLPAATYQLGMMVLDRTSRQRLLNWVENRITIGEA
ncbi:MAG: glycosyltransferase [Lachnospiraceae bacterium]|nr:glycosyltransferase [Lachnospiraceae bacterium]